jgi:hypothetical protein
MAGLFCMFLISIALFELASGYFNALKQTPNR